MKEGGEGRQDEVVVGLEGECGVICICGMAAVVGIFPSDHCSITHGKGCVEPVVAAAGGGMGIGGHLGNGKINHFGNDLLVNGQ